MRRKSTRAPPPPGRPRAAPRRPRAARHRRRPPPTRPRAHRRPRRPLGRRASQSARLSDPRERSRHDPPSVRDPRPHLSLPSPRTAAPHALHTPPYGRSPGYARFRPVFADRENSHAIPPFYDPGSCPSRTRPRAHAPLRSLHTAPYGSGSGFRFSRAKLRVAEIVTRCQATTTQGPVPHP